MRTQEIYHNLSWWGLEGRMKNHISECGKNLNIVCE